MFLHLIKTKRKHLIFAKFIFERASTTVTIVLLVND